MFAGARLDLLPVVFALVSSKRPLASSFSVPHQLLRTDETLPAALLRRLTLLQFRRDKTDLFSFYNTNSNFLTSMSSADDSNDKRDTSDSITILGFGSLLSERSSRMTFPDLTNFRLARVPNYRRVFGHPTSIFFQRGIADLESKQMSSLSAEYCEGFPGFIASVFEVPNHNGAMMQETGVPSEAFLEREEEFDIISVPYYELSNDPEEQEKHGLLCARSTDDAYLQRWNKERFADHFTKYGIDTIWNWKPDSGLLPCAVYLRHCHLAARAMGDECYDSFLDETFLVDRTTTVRQYVQQYPQVLQQEPPPDLAERYCG